MDLLTYNSSDCPKKNLVFQLITYVRDRTQFPLLDLYETCLLILSFCIALFLSLSTPIHYNADSEQYLKMAWYLLGDERGEYFYYRTPGFPLFLILTGVANFESFRGIIAVQIAMATLIPVITYRTFYFYNRSFAKITAALVLVSFFPYKYMNCVMTDHVAIFLQFLLLLLCSKFLKTNSRQYLIWLTLLLFFLALCRPAAGLSIIPVFLVLFFVKPSLWRFIVVCILLFASLNFGHSIIRAKILNPPNQYGYIATVGIMPGSGMSGHMFFWSIYSTARAYCSDCIVVAEENGPKTAKLFHKLRRYLTEQPAFMAYFPKKTDVEPVIQEIFLNTVPYNHSVLWLAMDNIMGPVEADKIFWDAAVESFWNSPSVAYFVWDGIVQFFWGYDVNPHQSGQVPKNPFLFEPSFFQTLLPGYESPLVSNAMRQEQNTPVIESKKYYSFIWHPILIWQFWLKVLALFVGAIFAPFWWKHNVKTIMSICVLLAGYQAIISILFWAPHVRYIDPVVPLVLMVAAAGVFYYFQDRKTSKILESEKECL